MTPIYLHTPALLRLARSHKAKFFIQFGGQGNSFLPELRILYSKWPELQEYFQVAFEAVQAIMRRPDVQEDLHVHYPYGFALQNWLEQRDVPPTPYLFTSPISFTGTQITQLAYVYLLNARGFHINEILSHTRAVTGHSQGMQSALALALGKENNDFLELMSGFTQWFGVAGYLMQKTYGIAKLEEEIIRESTEMDRQPPTPMCVISGPEEKQLQEYIDKFNQNKKLPEIEIALFNGPTLFVLSGDPLHLFRFRQRHLQIWKQHKWTWNYLDVSAPFHRKGFISHAVDLIIHDNVARFFPYRGSDLRLPLISYYDGSNFQQKGELAPLMIQTLAERQLYWIKAIHPLFTDPDITHILDLGPGKISALLTKSLLRDPAPEMISVTGSTGIKKILQE